jgi:hypothetical protein
MELQGWSLYSQTFAVPSFSESAGTYGAIVNTQVSRMVFSCKMLQLKSLYTFSSLSTAIKIVVCSIMRKEELDWKLYIVIENINLDVMHIR